MNCFNKHFISSGSLFDSLNPVSVKSGTNLPVYTGQPFNFVPFSVQEVCKGLKLLDPRKSPGPDLLDPYFLKLAADFVAEPLTTLFNLTLDMNEIPSVWKSAFVIPLLQGGDPAVLTNYRPISNLSVLAKVLEALVCEQLKEFLHTNAILSEYQSELVHTYKYLGILIDDSLTFKPHVENLVKNLKLKLRFYFQNKLCFSFNKKKRLVAATFLPVLDYGDILYMNASAQCLRMVDIVYHASLRFITNRKFQTHHCELYSQVGWPALVSRRNSYLYSFIYKAIPGLLPSYICSLLAMKHAGRYCLRPHGYLLLSVSFARTEFGKRAFVHSAPLAWNKLQKELKMTEFISLSVFKSKLRILEAKSITCNCFN
ncbi:solute carrier family 24 (sodium/potassium/calcium exchanger), member 5 [Sarotherodon galilaeus]